MKNFKIYVNEEYEEEKALFEINSEEVVLMGDYYHDKIDKKIEGFIIGLEYSEVDFTLSGVEENINHNDTLFDEIGFNQEWFDDEDEE